MVVRGLCAFGDSDFSLILSELDLSIIPHSSIATILHPGRQQELHREGSPLLKISGMR
jgi:hypothetical protein